jgi:ABC-2 type transport system ATP-binding protein
MTVHARANDPAAPASGLWIRGLSKRYRNGALANDGLDLEVRPGEVFGLLGPNGAGKTTLVKQIIGLLAPTAGTITLDGCDLVRHPARARELCSYLPQGTLPIDSLRLAEVVELVGRIRGGPRDVVRERARALITALELEPWAHEQGVKLSGGVQRLAGFLMASVWSAALVILDEPTNDVDPLRRRLLWRQVRELGQRGAAVLLVTHNVLEAEHAVDRLAVIDKGRILAQGTPSQLKVEERHQLRLSAALAGDGAALPSLPPFMASPRVLRRRLRVSIPERDAGLAIEWARGAMEAGVVEEYSLSPSSLEDVYIRLIGREDAADLA